MLEKQTGKLKQNIAPETLLLYKTRDVLWNCHCSKLSFIRYKIRIKFDTRKRTKLRTRGTYCITALFKLVHVIIRYYTRLNNMLVFSADLQYSRDKTPTTSQYSQLRDSSIWYVARTRHKSSFRAKNTHNSNTDYCRHNRSGAQVFHPEDLRSLPFH